VRQVVEVVEVVEVGEVGEVTLDARELTLLS